MIVEGELERTEERAELAEAWVHIPCYLPHVWVFWRTEAIISYEHCFKCLQGFFLNCEFSAPTCFCLLKTLKVNVLSWRTNWRMSPITWSPWRPRLRRWGKARDTESEHVFSKRDFLHIRIKKLTQHTREYLLAPPWHFTILQTSPLNNLLLPHSTRKRRTSMRKKSRS